MDIREFKKWIIENHFEENDLFQEALICYNNRAYKAAYMFSYLAFTNYMRYLIIDYEGIPLQFEKQWNEKLSKDNKTDCEKNQLITKKWHGIISELQDEDSWDGSLKNIINQEAYNIFCFDTKIRNEFTVKKDLRNVCAHNKDRNITNATVEDLWDFIVYIKPLSVINGTSEYIISKMKDILNLCNKSEYKEKAKEIYSFYESCYGNEKKQLFDKLHEQGIDEVAATAEADNERSNKAQNKLVENYGGYSYSFSGLNPETGRVINYNRYVVNTDTSGRSKDLYKNNYHNRITPGQQNKDNNLADRIKRLRELSASTQVPYKPQPISKENLHGLRYVPNFDKGSR